MNSEEPTLTTSKPIRADAQRNKNALLEAALDVFVTLGVDAPVREIAAKAGVGVGTVYRHFPERSDLIVAVFCREVDACADVAFSLEEEHSQFDALALWMQHYTSLIATKRGLAPALHSDDSAYSRLPSYFYERLRPALQKLLDGAIQAGEIRSDVEADDLLRAVVNLCMSAHDEANYVNRMVSLLIDGLRYKA
ncbi:MAG: TetR/AcrR family transcriptional regulator [Deinococcota bacterium]